MAVELKTANDLKRSLSSNEHEPLRFGATGREQMHEQLVQKDRKIVELAGRLADLAGQLTEQNQLIIDQNREIADQAREINVQKRQIEEKDRQLAQENREVRDMLARLVQREDPHRDPVAGTNGLDAGVTDRLERLENLMNQVCAQV